MKSMNARRPAALIADDDEIDRLLLSEATEQAGFEVTAVGDGEAALQAAMNGNFSIALFDVEMPGLNGYELCRRLRAVTRLKYLPVVMITGRDDAASISVAYEAGATDFVSKPLNWSLIPHRLQYILRNADAEKRIRELAYVDTTTALPNRTMFRELATTALTRCQFDQRRGNVAVLCLEVDSYTRISETFGGVAGEAAMAAFARRLQEHLPNLEGASAAMEFARFERGQFAICLTSAAPQADAVALSTAIAGLFAEPVVCNEHSFFMQPVIGIAVAPDHGSDVAALVMCADAAKHRARVSGSRLAVVYADEIGAEARLRMTLDGELRRAVRDQQLTLYYQPKIDLADGRLTGVEALLRWFHPDLGEISPGRFIPLAEESGLILEIGEWLVRAAFRQQRQWRADGFETTIAVNYSSLQFLHGTPAQSIAAAAQESGLEPGCILVEVTESVLISNLAVLRSGLEAVRALGCRVAVDDFGTGYSSLAYLKDLPVDELKIDRSFLRHVDVEPVNASIYTAILALARQLRLGVTAEGVETEGQLAWLRAQGCREAQGFLLARPMPQWELVRRYGSAASTQSSTALGLGRAG